MTDRLSAAHATPKKWGILWLLALVMLLSNAVWFSATAVAPQLAAEWGLNSAGQSWLTMSVQLGFVVGTLLSAFLNLADRVPLAALISASALLASASNAAIALFVSAPGPAHGLRFLAGMAMAGIYPPGMKLVATWCAKDRGLGMGLLVGALTLGSAAPHLLAALASPAGLVNSPWRRTLLLASLLALAGAVLAAASLKPGPLLPASSPFNPRYALKIWRSPSLRLANFGYFGHMWELYAMWAWAPAFMLAAYRQAGWTEQAGHIAGFSVVAAGAFGCLGAGVLADRIGRTLTTSLSLAISGSCALVAGLLLGSPAALTAVCVLWGLAVVADSAQFSAAVSELGDPSYIGTALTVQTCLGFLLTMVTIRLVPVLQGRLGWFVALAALSLGPGFGLVSMLRLRRRADASLMAAGRK